MSTELTTEELVAFGARVRVDHLIEQAGYTFGLAALDGVPLKDLLPGGYIDEAGKFVAKLNTARQDKAATEAESKDASRATNEAFVAGKLWRRKTVRRAQRAKRLGKNIPDGLLKVTPVSSPQVLAGNISEMTKLLETNIAAIGVAGTDKMVESGKKIAQTLQEVDAKQEIKRLSQLPDAVKNYYQQKGALYVALKVINDAGRELHADNPMNAAKYNLSILHRRAAAKAKVNPPATATPKT